jgi:ribonuclease HI
MYDHGLVGPQDDTETDFCKGECDASYETGLASLAFIIWRGEKIIYSEILKNVSCKSATESELYAAFALLSKAKELGIQKMLLCSDCVTICDVLSGQHCIQNVEAKSPEDYDQNIKASSPPKGYDQLVLYLMLRSMKWHFKNLISMWKPRELMVFADDLAKANEVVVGDPHFLGQVMQKWSYHLKGLPLLRIEWTE